MKRYNFINCFFSKCEAPNLSKKGGPGEEQYITERYRSFRAQVDIQPYPTRLPFTSFQTLLELWVVYEEIVRARAQEFQSVEHDRSTIGGFHGANERTKLQSAEWI